MNECLVQSLLRYVGQTVTIFTESGGISGSGFSGTLACVDECNIKLITQIGLPPACPISFTCGYPGYGYGYGGGCGCGGCGDNCCDNGCGGGCCGGYPGYGYGFPGYGYGGGCCDNGCNGGGGGYPGYGYGYGYGYGFNSSWLGSVTEIPICKIVSFTHNAI